MPADPKLVRDLFLATAELPEAERAAYLQAQTKGDAELLAAVERLLAAHEQPASFLSQPAIEEMATIPPRPGQFSFDGDVVGSFIGPYKLLQKLGEGGMGIVWVAEQERPVKRRVALKLVKAGMDTAQVVRRFEAERQALAMMDHTNIAKVLDVGTTSNGRPFFVMELVKGVPITRYCDEVHASIEARLELFVQVCSAVQHAHQKGIIHRDIKPSNVLVAMQDGKPVPKVIDFGVAKALHTRLADKTMYTEIGQVIGTLEYMAPEQAELSAMDIDTRADIYALGVVLYELLTGSTPITHERMKSAAISRCSASSRKKSRPSRVRGSPNRRNRWLTWRRSARLIRSDSLMF
ncbi:MAG: serine/threonine-protein kinase [Gemmatales bacterium]